MMVSAVMAALVLLSVGFLCRRRLQEEYWLRELESRPVERKLLAARRLGEIRSSRAVAAMIREFKTIAETAELEGLHNYAYQVFQEALLGIGAASLPELVRNIPSEDPLDADLYVFVQDTIQILYLNIPHRDPGYKEGVS